MDMPVEIGVGSTVRRDHVPAGARFQIDKDEGFFADYQIYQATAERAGNGMLLSSLILNYEVSDTIICCPDYWKCLIIGMPRQPAMINSGLYDAIKKLDNYRDSYVTTGQEIKMRKFVPTPISRHEAIAIANEIRERAEHERNEGLTVAKTKEIAESSSGPSLDQRIADCPRNIDAEIILRSHRSRRQYDMDALNDPRTGDWYV